MKLIHLLISYISIFLVAVISLNQLERMLAVLIKASFAEVMRIEAVKNGDCATENAFEFERLFAMFLAISETRDLGAIKLSNCLIRSIVKSRNSHIFDPLLGILVQDSLDRTYLLLQVVDAIE